ncbi:PREDICTED: apolipoprotein M [Nanorana parkeri]|uniref:apolipoprotein M n=1 Tax=Nanorana parkeri TaxID=125878 RepID=UPI000854E4DE|nr:PREDICTED: apolipoprotein M [Nanorana parkeri]
MVDFILNSWQFPLQYMGKWHFLAAAAHPKSQALEIFTVMDNAQFTVRESTETEKLEFTASIRVKDGSCVPRSWIYLLNESSNELRTEGHPDRLTKLYACRCPNCIILKEIDDSTDRLLLYSRSQQLEEGCMDEFKHKSDCKGYKDILWIPQTLELSYVTMFFNPTYQGFHPHHSVDFMSNGQLNKQDPAT